MKLSLGNLDYFLSSAAKRARGAGSSCPSCGAPRSALITNKYWVTQLRRCHGCKLLFRAPATTEAENAAFYQKGYVEGFTTQLPPAAELRRLMAASFRATERDYSRFLRILHALGLPKGSRLLDFGCSWGYGSWQMRQAGYDVESYEISVPRGDYAREHLGCTVHASLAAIRPGFDVVFASHVLEHVPSVRAAMDFAFSALKPAGLFLAFTPNGSMAHRAKDPAGWQKSWGHVHPNLLDEHFYRQYLAGRPYLMASDPYDLGAMADWPSRGSDQRVLDLSGGELMCAARAMQATSDVHPRP